MKYEAEYSAKRLCWYCHRPLEDRDKDEEEEVEFQLGGLRYVVHAKCWVALGVSNRLKGKHV